MIGKSNIIKEVKIVINQFWRQCFNLYIFHKIYHLCFIKSYYFIYVKIFLCFWQLFSNAIAHNVPAVGDVFAARIRALRSKDQGCKNVGGVWRGNEA
jgi:hypothetical protein